MNCIYKKIRSKKGIKYGYCILLKKEVNLYNCKCENINYKEYKTLSTNKPINKTTKRQRKANNNRYSIIYPPLDKCVVCGAKNGLNKHEVYFGKNRQNSIKYGLVISLCEKHHTGDEGIHFNNELNTHWRTIARKRFNEEYPTLDFTSIFKSK